MNGAVDPAVLQMEKGHAVSKAEALPVGRRRIDGGFTGEELSRRIQRGRAVPEHILETANILGTARGPGECSRGRIYRPEAESVNELEVFRGENWPGSSR
jgi:hypothetical protein